MNVSDLLGKIFFREVGQRSKGRGITYSDVREDFTVDRTVSLFEPMNHAAIGDAVCFRSGVDASDPETTEVAFFLAAITV